MEFLQKQIKIDPPKRPKKLTATRFAAALGENNWVTPFEAWCAITRTYEKPFEDTIYTTAGKVIEPKIIDYLNNVLFMDIKSPTDVYGEDYFSKTRGDFFPQHNIFGGMWDAIGNDFVVEIKTTKRVEDWTEDIPIYYKLQACLYAHLLRIDKVMVVVGFLDEQDYINPEAFVPTCNNTKVYYFKLSEDFPTFEDDYILPAVQWWNKHVIAGISPEWDEKKDAEILKELRTNYAEVTDSNLTKLINEADRLQLSIDNAKAKLADKEKRLKTIDSQIKTYMIDHFRDGDKLVKLSGKKYDWTLTLLTRQAVDSEKMKKDGIYNSYLKSTDSYTLRKKLREAEQ